MTAFSWGFLVADSVAGAAGAAGLAGVAGLAGAVGFAEEPDKSMYHFCLQEEGQPGRTTFLRRRCLKRVNCSRIV